MQRVLFPLKNKNEPIDEKLKKNFSINVERNQKAHSHVFRLGSKLSRFKLSNFLPSEGVA